MKVGELIERLKAFDPELPVKAWFPYQTETLYEEIASAQLRPATHTAQPPWARTKWDEDAHVQLDP